MARMTKVSKGTLDRHHIVQRMESDGYATAKLLQLIENKIEASVAGIEPSIDVLLIRNGTFFYPKANIEDILRVLRYERKFEAFIKLNHAFSCKCGNCDPPCCRWLTVKNTWAFPENKTS